MNLRHPIGVLHSFSIKNIFYDKMDLKLFLFSCEDLKTTGYLFLIGKENEQWYEKGGYSFFGNNFQEFSSFQDF